MNRKNHEWQKDYQDFLNSEIKEIPPGLKQGTFLKVQRLIKPNAWMVFFKLLSIHIVVGFLSLSVCHQFGLNPFNTEISLADWYMTVGGHHFCMVGCGITFVSVSILTAGYLFTFEEIRALKRNDILHNISLGIISLGLFVAFGAELAFGIAAFWMLGSLIGGLFAMTAVFKIKGAGFHQA